MNNNKIDYTIKAMVIGNMKSGKSSFISRICDNTYIDDIASTLV